MTLFHIGKDFLFFCDNILTMLLFVDSSFLDNLVFYSRPRGGILYALSSQSYCFSWQFSCQFPIYNLRTASLTTAECSSVVRTPSSLNTSLAIAPGQWRRLLLMGHTREAPGQYLKRHSGPLQLIKSAFSFKAHLSWQGWALIICPHRDNLFSHPHLIFNQSSVRSHFQSHLTALIYFV